MVHILATMSIFILGDCAQPFRFIPHARFETQTDVAGTLMVASDLFRTSPARTDVLVVFSDMRNDTPALDLEHARIVSTSFAMQKAEKERLLPDLHGVEVYILGVDGSRQGHGVLAEPALLQDHLFQANRRDPQELLSPS